MGVATWVIFKRMVVPHIGHSLSGMILEPSSHVSIAKLA
jgi:hypothetical protein